MIVKVNKKDFNNEFGDTWLKCTFAYNVYFDEEKCEIIFKHRNIFKFFMTIIFPFLLIFQVLTHGILCIKQCFIDYTSFMKEDIYKTEWIMSEKSWIYKSMCNVLKKETLLKKEVNNG